MGIFYRHEIKAKCFCLLLIVVFSAAPGHAQTATLADDTDIQSWNDIQLTVPMTKHFDFQTQFAFRFGKNVSKLNDGRYTIGFVWKPHKSFSINPFYTHLGARNSFGRFRIEHRLNLRAAYRFPFNKFGLSHRSTFENRLRHPVNSWRYRPSLTFETDLPKRIIPKAKLYVSEEIFYDSLLRRFSRNRFTVGINKTLSKQLSLDIYYMRQNDGFSRPGDLHVFGTIFKIKP